VFQDPKYQNREHLISKKLNHPNCIKIYDLFMTRSGKQVYLNLVMDYLPLSLDKVIRQMQKYRMDFPSIVAKVYAYQMFRALAYINQLFIVHRDIKP